MRILTVVLLLAFFGNVVRADGLIRDGMGAISAARGGTNLAWADNGTILHDNAAGLINMDANSHVEVGIDFLFTDVDYQEAGGMGDYRRDVVPQGHLSFSKKVHEDVAVGLGIFTPGGFATKTLMPGPLPFAGERNYQSFGALLRILPGVSLRMTDRLSLGFTTGVAANHMEVEGPYTLQSGVVAGTPTILDFQGTGAAFSWSVGMQYQLTPCTTLGFNYQSENRFDLDGTARTDLFVPGVGFLESSFDASTRVVWPQSVGAGVRHQMSQQSVASVDLIYHNWQRSFDQFRMLLSDATNPIVATFGDLDERVPLRWRDTLSVRLGYERTLRNCDRFRAGYVYHRNPIPSSTLTTYIAPIVEHTISFGYGTCYRGLQVDVGYQYMFGDEVAIGDSALVGDDFSNSTLDAEAHFLYVSFGRKG